MQDGESRMQYSYSTV